MTHRNAVANSDGIEFKGYAAGGADSLFDPLGHLVEMHMARYDFTETIGYANEGLVHILIFQAAGP
jgi:hypothetical protein